MFGFLIVLFMVVGFVLCGLWAHSGTAKQRRAEEALAEAAEARHQQQEQARAAAKVQREAEKAKRQQEAEAKQREAEQRREARRQQQEASRAARLQYAREMAELKERELAAAREIQLLKYQQRAERRGDISNPALPANDTADAEAPQTPIEAAQAVTLEGFAAAYAQDGGPVEPVQEAPADAPGPFSGQVVAFTGTLKRSGMTRRQAAEKVRQAGGRAYDREMPAGTTLLVVGDNPGIGKMDKADRWIGQVRKITEAQFLARFAA